MFTFFPVVLNADFCFCNFFSDLEAHRIDSALYRPTSSIELVTFSLIVVRFYDCELRETKESALFFSSFLVRVAVDEKVCYMFR